MQSVLARPRSSESPSHHRTPRKSSSFLSLRRENEKGCSPVETSSIADSRSPYFEAYSQTSRSSKPRTKQTLPDSSPNTSEHVRRDKVSKSSQAPSSYAFPTVEAPDILHLADKPHSRARSKTGPSSRPNLDWMDNTAPALRFSGSSAQPETPPDTPLDPAMFAFPVLVSAPVSGVETMDALVDNMNGGEDMLAPSLSSRARFGIPNHHPLYEPPLPTPPPGVVLGGGKARRSKRPSKIVPRSSFSEDEDDDNLPPPRRRRPHRAPAPRTLPPSPAPSSEPPTPIEDVSPLSNAAIPPRISPPRETPKTLAPSISEIIRAYVPTEARVRPRLPFSRNLSKAYSQQSHGAFREESEVDSEVANFPEDSEAISRSSVDSIADEVRRTLRKQTSMKPAPPSSYSRRQSIISDNTSIYSPKSDGGAASTYASSVTSHQPHSPFESSNHLASSIKQSPSQAVAQYLRSTRLTTLLKLTRSPHASQDNPLTVSLSDLGSSSGYPIVVFLGLGCVRHVMGLYDEMSECLGLRLITIDRWGLGRTEPRSKSAKGVMEWASVVEEVLDLLHIDQCSVMAHSAGAPYALSFANKLRHRIRGEICLLAPWVGGSENGSYKWLKYVPNGLLKTAQAAEWKLQAWMIGKPPTLAYEGIGYTAETKTPNRGGSPSNVYPSSSEVLARPSIASSTFSDYDDLRDFDGRFESRSTLGAEKYGALTSKDPKLSAKRKNSRGFLERFRSSPGPQSPSSENKPQPGKKLKALRSMGSLKSKYSPKRAEVPNPELPPSLKFDGLGLDDANWTPSVEATDNGSSPYPRANGRRSVSLTSPREALSLPSSPTPSTHNLPLSTNSAPSPRRSNSGTGNSYQAALANALIAASHAESAKGTHLDLLQILNHDNHPWGFSYSSYPHRVDVWYGDKDEKIAENAVRWMERNMGENQCHVKVVKGADHGLMYNSSVVVEVMEKVLSYWQPTP